MRQNTGSFKYARAKNYTDGPIGSCARNPHCELALYLAGESDQSRLGWALSNFFKWRHELEDARSADKGGHGAGGEALEGIASYYFFYGHLWAFAALHYLDKNARIEISKGGIKDQKSGGKTKSEVETKTPGECTKMLQSILMDIQGNCGKSSTKLADGKIEYKERKFEDGRWGATSGGSDFETAVALIVLSGQNFLSYSATRSNGSKDKPKSK
jgi:hypothetical protein